MRIILIISGLLFFSPVFSQQPPKVPLRIADTLTSAEKANRSTIILKSELDSLIDEYLVHENIRLESKPPLVVYKNAGPEPWTLGILMVTFLLTLILFIRALLQREGNRPLVLENTRQKAVTNQTRRNGKLNNEPESEWKRLLDENERLEKLVAESNGNAKTLENIRASFEKTYKIKNYPGYDSSTNQMNSITKVLDAEHGISNFAYHRFIKPILAISDANKNHPARITTEESTELVNLFISLSLFYIESLYLRVQDLAVGGKIVERIQAILQGKYADPSRLKRLDKEFGSRALVVRIALEKAGLSVVHYPVFEDTNLNEKL